MTLIGFKRATIGIFDEKGKVTAKHVLEGKANEGATVSAEISGMASEAVKTYGSNIAYYVMQKGTGDVTVNLGLLDLPEKFNDQLLGYGDGEGIAFIGEKTKAPYAALLLETESVQGKPVCLGFFKGKFSKSELALNTSTNENTELEADSYMFSALSSDKEDESKGSVIAKAFGEEDKTKLVKMLFPEVVTEG